MFRIVDTQVIEWPVKIRKPLDDGKIRIWETKARFKVHKQSVHDAFYESGGTDLDMLLGTVEGWSEKDWQARDGSELAFSVEALRELYDDSHVRAAFVVAVLEFRNGREAARKNS